MRAVNQEAKTIFLQAIEIHSLEQREEFIDQSCGGDGRLRNQVLDLVQAFDQPNSILDGEGLFAEIGSNLPDPVGNSIGHFEVRELIGEGGMGLVYLAQQTEPVRRQVALKIIRPGMASKEVVARFEAERQALAMMDHPNIAHVFDGGITESGQPYFAMELVNGVPITHYCDTCRLETSDRLNLFVRVCQAVQHAHQKGVIHRDLKPSNILVAMQDGIPTPKIIDFGVAKAVGTRLTDHTLRTRYAQLIGTPMYMSPEQAELRPIDVDTRSDVYSLGVLLYELLTGATPFSRERLENASFDELRYIIREEEPPRPSALLSTLAADASTTLNETHRIAPRQLANQLRGELDWIVMKALEKDRTRRYASAGKLAEDVEHYLHNEPIEARPASAAYQVSKFTRRHRALVVSVAAIVLALSAGLALATIGFRQAVEERQIAEQRLAQVENERRNNDALLGFYQSMFEAPHGQETTSGQRTVQDLLDSLSSSLKERSGGRPQVETELLRIVARMYRDIGDPNSAREHQLLALELAEGEGGYDEHSEEYADLLVDLAGQIDWPDKPVPFDFADTKKRAEKAVQIYEQLGVETFQTADAYFYLSQFYNPMEPLVVQKNLRRTMEIVDKLASPERSARQVWARIDLALSLARMDVDDRQEAIDLIEEALAMSQRVHGVDDPMTATTWRYQGIVFLNAGNIERALDSFGKAWEIYQSAGYENEPKGHSCALQVAEALHCAGRYNEANESLEEVEALCKKHESWQSLAKCLLVRGLCELDRENYEDAYRYFLEAADAARLHGGDNLELGILCSFYVARTLDLMDRPDEAQVAYRQLQPLTGKMSRFEGIAPNAQYYHVWSMVRGSVGDIAAINNALQAAEAGLSFAKIANDSANRFRTSQLHLSKAIALDALGRTEEAIAELNSGIALLRKPFPSPVEAGAMNYHYRDPPKSRRDLELTLARILAEEDRIDEAIEVFKDGISFRESFSLEEFPAKNLQVALARLRFGEFLVDHRHILDAEVPLQQAYGELSTNLEAAKTTIQRAAEQLVTVYQATDRPMESVRLQKVLEQLNETVEESEEPVEDTQSDSKSAA